MPHPHTIARPLDRNPSAAAGKDGRRRNGPSVSLPSTLSHVIAWLAVVGLAVAVAAAAYGLGELLWAMGARV